MSEEKDVKDSKDAAATTTTKLRDKKNFAQVMSVKCKSERKSWKKVEEEKKDLLGRLVAHF